jgi:hypothetical protein
MQKRICFFLVMMMVSMLVCAQTNPSSQILPYSEGFGTTSFNILPSGFSAWNGLSGTTVNSLALAEASNPTGNAGITARTTATTTGGVYGMSQSSDGKLYFQSSSNATEGVSQLVLGINTGTAHAIKISFDIEIIEAGTGRTMGSVLQYRQGNTGTWATVPGSAQIYNNLSSNGGDADINGDGDHFSYVITGLAAFSDYQLRWAHWRSGSTGNSVGLAYDDIDICALPDVFDLTGGGNYCAGSDGVGVGLAGSQQGVMYHLKKDGSDVAQVLGTGEAISFGYQLNEGSFSVTASFPGSCFIEMNGSVNVSVQQLPNAHGGPDQDLCEQNSAVLSADIPAAGIGWWSQVEGPSVFIEDPLSPLVQVNGLEPGNYVFRWTVQYGNCPLAEDDVIISIALPIPQAYAGGDKKACGLSSGLEAILPLHASGNWTFIAGTGEVNFSDASDPSTIITVTVPGEYIFRWTITNGCYVSSDDVKLFFNHAPIITSQLSVPDQILQYGEEITPLVIDAIDHGEDELMIYSEYSFNNGSSQTGLPGNLQIEKLSTESEPYKWVLKTGTGVSPAPGLYNIRIEIKDHCNESAILYAKFIVNAGNVIPIADAFYTGACFFWTSNANSKTATLSLAATLKNSPGSLGDIRTAKVSFYIREGGQLIPIQGAQNLAVGLVNAGDLNVGAASATVQYHLGNVNAALLNIAVIVSGNYNVNDPAKDKNITVAVPLPGGQICGGIEIMNTASSGLIAGADGVLTTVGFFVQYNSSLRNLQGKVEIRVNSYNNRNGVTGPDLQNYIVRSNSISGLNISDASAQFSAKASIFEIINGVEYPVEGNCMLQLNIIDGTEDKIAITLYRNKGGIWYASNWNGSSTSFQDIFSGNLSVTSTVALPKNQIQKKERDDLMVSVFPNPAPSGFRFIIRSADYSNKINIIMRDMAGRVIRRSSYSPEQRIIENDHLLAKGIYLIEVIQGEKNLRVMLVKQ